MGKGNEVALGAVCSMNYFFLRFVTKKPGYHIQIIKDELERFVEDLINEGEALSDDYKEVIITEIKVGSYFDDKSEEEVRQLLTEALNELVGEAPGSVIDLYVDLAKKADVLR